MVPIDDEDFGFHSLFIGSTGAGKRRTPCSAGCGGTSSREDVAFVPIDPDADAAIAQGADLEVVGVLHQPPDSEPQGRKDLLEAGEALTSSGMLDVAVRARHRSTPWANPRM